MTRLGLNAATRVNACYVCHKGGGGNESHPENPTTTNYSQPSPTPDAQYVDIALDNAIVGFGAGKPQPSYSGTKGLAANATNGWKTCNNTTCHYAESPSWAGKKQISGDTVTMTWDNQASGSVAKGSVNNKMLRISLTADSIQDGAAAMTVVRVTRTGTGVDADVPANGVKVYLDDGDGVFEPGVQDGSPVGTGSFVSGVANISVGTQALSTVAKAYWISVDVASGATGTSLGVRLASSADVTITSPDTIASANFPANSTVSTITTPMDTLSILGTTIAPSTADKGTYAGMLKLSMTASGSADNSVSWNQIRVIRTGQGANTDVDNVVIALDDGDGNYEGLGIDTAIGSATLAVDNTALVTVTSQTVTNSAPKSYYVVFHIASGATTNDNVIARVADNNAFTVTSAGDLSSLGSSPTDSGPRTNWMLF